MKNLESIKHSAIKISQVIYWLFNFYNMMSFGKVMYGNGILNGEPETIFNAVNFMYIKESSKHFLQWTEEEYGNFIIKVVYL